jgi:hypothetical protein
VRSARPAPVAECRFRSEATATRPLDPLATLCSWPARSSFGRRDWVISTSPPSGCSLSLVDHRNVSLVLLPKPVRMDAQARVSSSGCLKRENLRVAGYCNREFGYKHLLATHRLRGGPDASSDAGRDVAGGRSLSAARRASLRDHHLSSTASTYRLRSSPSCSSHSSGAV